MSVAISSHEELSALLLKEALVVVKFGAAWCGPCKLIQATFDNKAREFPRIRFVTVDVDEVSDSPSRHPSSGIVSHIKSLPTFKVFRDGKELGTFVGPDKIRLEHFINEHCQ